MVSSITERSQYGLNGIKFWLLKKREVLEFRVSTLLIELFNSNGLERFCTQQSDLFGPKLVKGYMEKQERIVKHVRKPPCPFLMVGLSSRSFNIIRGQETDLMVFIHRKKGQRELQELTEEHQYILAREDYGGIYSFRFEDR
ncbi:hypothetical protein Tco_1270141 [Tanacetum coccineum]